MGIIDKRRTFGDELFGSDDIYTILGPEQCIGKTMDEG